MKVKPIKQINSIACGAACIKMAAAYFNLNYSWKKIAEISKYKQKDGLYNKDLVKALQKLGFKTAEKANVSWEQLKKLNSSDKIIIVSWMLKGYIGHFSVVDKVTDKAIYLADPEAGKIIKLDKIVFLRLWLDYEPHWYPRENSDIQLRWVVGIEINKRKSRF